jgi:hypothetical protein
VEYLDTSGFLSLAQAKRLGRSLAGIAAARERIIDHRGVTGQANEGRNRVPTRIPPGGSIDTLKFASGVGVASRLRGQRASAKDTKAGALARSRTKDGIA